jgi:hypothetical protein
MKTLTNNEIAKRLRGKGVCEPRCRSKIRPKRVKKRKPYVPVAPEEDIPPENISRPPIEVPLGANDIYKPPETRPTSNRDIPQAPPPPPLDKAVKSAVANLDLAEVIRMNKQLKKEGRLTKAQRQEIEGEDLMRELVSAIKKPKLKKATERKLKEIKKEEKTLHERLMDDIKSKVQHTVGGVLWKKKGLACFTKRGRKICVKPSRFKPFAPDPKLRKFVREETKKQVEKKLKDIKKTKKYKELSAKEKKKIPKEIYKKVIEDWNKGKWEVPEEVEIVVLEEEKKVKPKKAKKVKPAEGKEEVEIVVVEEKAKPKRRKPKKRREEVEIVVVEEKKREVKKATPAKGKGKDYEKKLRKAWRDWNKELDRLGDEADTEEEKLKVRKRIVETMRPIAGDIEAMNKFTESLRLIGKGVSGGKGEYGGFINKLLWKFGKWFLKKQLKGGKGTKAGASKNNYIAYLKKFKGVKKVDRPPYDKSINYSEVEEVEIVVETEDPEIERCRKLLMLELPLEEKRLVESAEDQREALELQAEVRKGIEDEERAKLQDREQEVMSELEEEIEEKSDEKEFYRQLYESVREDLNKYVNRQVLGEKGLERDIDIMVEQLRELRRKINPQPWDVGTRRTGKLQDMPPLEDDDPLTEEEEYGPPPDPPVRGPDRKEERVRRIEALKRRIPYAQGAWYREERRIYF